ncbi:Mitochondrial copper homeostasis protein [Neonectria punicea]|uniref:Mitochondrial copper homeostasis protein n=1 Tax=Neonectria punicea TaxID=979145 RepID=A0ABR1HJK7_9HYPO
MASQEAKEPKAPESTAKTSTETPSEATTDANSAAWSDDKRRKFETKSKSEYYDPCQEAAQRSYKCLFRNGGDKAMCGEYFQAYRDCKQAWTEERKKKSGSWF